MMQYCKITVAIFTAAIVGWLGIYGYRELTEPARGEAIAIATDIDLGSQPCGEFVELPIRVRNESSQPRRLLNVPGS